MHFTSPAVWPRRPSRANTAARAGPAIASRSRAALSSRPAIAGRGTAEGGGRGAGLVESLATKAKLGVRRPLHRASRGPPPPLSRGRMHFTSPAVWPRRPSRANTAARAGPAIASRSRAALSSRPAIAGRGDRRRRWEGRGHRRFSYDESEARSQTPPPPRFARSPSPAFAGADAFHFPGGLAAKAEPRKHSRPRGSCHSFSVACRWAMARAMVTKSYLANFSATSV